MFIARNRFAVLDKAANQIQIRNLQNEVSRRANTLLSRTFVDRICVGMHFRAAHARVLTWAVCLPKITKKSNSPTATTDAIFYAGTGALLCRSEDKVKTC